MSADVGFYCVICHLSVAISPAGGYALVLQDDVRYRRRTRRIPLESLRSGQPD